jgi:uncharacterized protein (TIGR00299 family) protein
MQVLVIDPSLAGITGEMLLAALIDATGTSPVLDTLADRICALGWCEELTFLATEKTARGIPATHLDIRVCGGHGPADRDPTGALHSLATACALSPAAQDRAMAVLKDLIRSDGTLRSDGASSCGARVLFTVMGCLRILDREGLMDATVVSTPPALGRGTIRDSLGTLSGPDPDVLSILTDHHIPWAHTPVDRALITPAGAALLANIAASFDTFYPAMTPLRIGYGTASGTEEDSPQLLRVVLGKDGREHRERVVMLETNLDDVTGETIGHTIERMLECGAADVFVVPAIGKKNRPVFVLTVMADPRDAPRLARTLIDETGTVGVRLTDTPKIVADRSRQKVTLTIAGKTVGLQVKTSRIDGDVIRVKPEYEDLKKIAAMLGIPLRHVREEVRRQLLGMGIEML